jgi:YVTN family beta-propeller protein
MRLACGGRGPRLCDWLPRLLTLCFRSADGLTERRHQKVKAPFAAGRFVCIVGLLCSLWVSSIAVQRGGAAPDHPVVLPLGDTLTSFVFDPATSRAFLGTHDARLGNLVVVLDGRTGQVVGTTRVEGQPLALGLALQGQRVVALTEARDSGIGSLDVLDAASGTLLHTEPVAGHPNAMALDEARGWAVVTTRGRGGTAVALYDTASLAPLARIPLHTQAQPVAVTAEGGHGLVLTVDGNVYLIDELAARVMREISVGFGASYMTSDSQSDNAFVANEVSNTVSIVDMATGELRQTIGVGLTPSGLGVDGQLRRVLSVNAVDGTLSVLDESTGVVLHTVSVGPYPRGISVDEQSGLVAIPTDNGVSIVDTATGALLRRMRVGVGAAAAFLGGQPGLLVTAPVMSPQVQVQVLGGPARQTPRPAGPSVARSLAVLRNFVDAYNRHDVQGVLSALDGNVQYFDCDMSAGMAAHMNGTAAVRAWLQARFAEHDRFLQADISVPPGPTSPLVASLETVRVNDFVLLGHRVMVMGVKIFLAKDGGHLATVEMGGGPNCASVPP